MCDGLCRSISSSVILLFRKTRSSSPSLAQILNKVVRERVVVIDHHDHNSNPPFARLIALISARDLFTVSVYSLSGTESATIPPPA